MAVLCTPFPAFAEIISNETTGVSCGANLTWEYNTETKVLTISGTGAMSDFDWQTGGMLAPWVKNNNIYNYLETVVISDGVTSIGNEAFYSCFDLASITVDPDNPAYCSESGILYSKEKTEIIRFPKEKAGDSFAIPAGVIKIADGAFEDCRNLKSVTIPDGVISIGDNSFNACENLTGIIIPDGVPSIGEKTFCGCKRLTSVTIPNSVIRIGENAFLNCDKLKKVNYIESTVEWNAIEKGNGYSIADALITYCSGISAKYANYGKIIIRQINTGSGKTVILALYDGDVFVEVQSATYTDEDIPFTTEKDYKTAKVMVWNNLEDITPICDVEIVK